MAAACLVLAVGGCFNNQQKPSEIQLLRERVESLEEKNDELQELVVKQRTQIDQQSERIANLMEIAPDRLKRVLKVDRIELADRTGGFQEDDQPGDDGVRVFLRPIDQDGQLLKAAGEIVVEVYDLANPDGLQKLGAYEFSPEEAREVWHERLWTGHYTLECPWRLGPPVHRELTIRVRFVELLTGLPFTAQGVFEVDLPPDESTPIS